MPAIPSAPLRLRALATAALALLLAACAAPAGPPAPAAPLTLRIVAFNDFHGYLQPPAGGAPLRVDGQTRSVPAGGAAVLTTAVRTLRAEQPHSIVVAAGDLIGASPLESALQRDEPTVAALDALDLSLSAVGNHEFDRGRAELLRLQRGGCPPEGCTGAPFAGARFQWLAANVIDTASGKPVLPPYAIRRFDGVPVAFVGVVLESTPRVVNRAGIVGLEFRDEADSINALVPELKAQGVHAIVALIHEGGASGGDTFDRSCPGFVGALVDIERRLAPAVDLVISGHTHQVYTCMPGAGRARWITSAGFYGGYLTAIDLVLDRASGRVRRVDANNVLVDPARFAPDPAVARLVAEAAERSAPRAQRVVGRIGAPLSLVPDAAGDSAIGRVVADALLAEVADTGARFALTNPGGLRAPLLPRPPDGSVTFGDLFTVLPFGNNVVTMTLTGEQIVQLLEQQWRAGDRQRVLLTSTGLAYTWDGAAPVGQRVRRDTVRIGGQPLDPAARYRVALNSFLANGGDAFTVATQGTERVTSGFDLDALERHIAAGGAASVPAARIQRVN